jgi:hypothetical protein
MDQKAFMSEVSDLMLEGWSMLSSTCPNRGCANCVLLGNKAKVTTAPAPIVVLTPFYGRVSSLEV